MKNLMRSLIMLSLILGAKAFAESLDVSQFDCSEKSGEKLKAILNAARLDQLNELKQICYDQDRRLLKEAKGLPFEESVKKIDGALQTGYNATEIDFEIVYRQSAQLKKDLGDATKAFELESRCSKAGSHTGECSYRSYRAPAPAKCDPGYASRISVYANWPDDYYMCYPISRLNEYFLFAGGQCAPEFESEIGNKGIVHCFRIKPIADSFNR